MSWEIVARKDVRDLVRSYWLWGLSAIFVGVLAMPPALVVLDVIQITQSDGPRITTNVFNILFADTMTILVPAVAIVLAYASVAGERDAGTLKLLLSLPHSRRDVVLGKLLGRSVVVVAALLAGFVVAAAVFLLTPIAIDARNYVLFALLTALLGVVFVAIAVGFSAAADSDRWAMIGTVGTFVIFTLFWNRFTDGLIQVLTDHAGLAGAGRVKLHLVLKVLNPTQAYKSLVFAIDTPGVVEAGNASYSHAAVARSQLVGGQGLQAQFRQQQYLQALGTDAPFYLTDAFLVLMLLAWLVGVPLLGYLVFRETDL